MQYAQLLWFAIKFYVKKILRAIKSGVWAEGGLFSGLFHPGSMWNRTVVLIILYSIYAILKKNGYWFKKSIRGKHVFLTGAGSGLGRLVSIRLAKLGAKLTIVDINEKGCQTTKNMIKAQAKSEDVQVFQLDVSNRQQIADVCKQTTEGFGPVDILINNAGLVQGKFLMDMDEDLAHKVMTVNAESNWWIIREFLPEMMNRNSGHIVAIASLAGMVGSAGLSDYCASKFA